MSCCGLLLVRANIAIAEMAIFWYDLNMSTDTPEGKESAYDERMLNDELLKYRAFLIADREEKLRVDPRNRRLEILRTLYIRMRQLGYSARELQG